MKQNRATPMFSGANIFTVLTSRHFTVISKQIFLSRYVTNMIQSMSGDVFYPSYIDCPCEVKDRAAFNITARPDIAEKLTSHFVY